MATLAHETRENPFDQDKKGGMPSKIQDAMVRRQLEGALLAGASINQAASVAGINPSTFRRWRLKAEAGEEPYATFFEDLHMARDRAILRRLSVIDAAAAAGTWQAAAWWLERNFPELYGQRSRHEVTGKDGESIVVELKWPD